MTATSPVPAGLRAALWGLGVAVLGMGLALVATIDMFQRERSAGERTRAAVESLRDSLNAARGGTSRAPRPGGADGPGGAGPIEGITPGEIATLRARGLADPVSDLKTDLVRHPELIPAPGTLGGRMGFYDRDRIWILNGRWVCADFEDGHVGGSVLLEYRVDNGVIGWRRIATLGP